jgi:hypothetical protein
MKRTYRAGLASGKSRELKRHRTGLDQRRERAAAKLSLEEMIDLGPVQLPLGPEALQAMLSDELHSFAIDLGLLMAGRFLEAEVRRLCGQRYERQPQRQHTRYGHQPGFVTVAGQKATIRRPRVRQAGGGREVELPLYQTMQSPAAMPEAALKRLVRGVSTRNYEEVVDLAREGFGVQKSSVSRAFVKATAAAIQELSARRLDQERFLAIFLDGVEYAGETMLVALGITQTGEKQVLIVAPDPQVSASSGGAAIREPGADDACGKDLPRVRFFFRASSAVESAAWMLQDTQRLATNCEPDRLHDLAQTFARGAALGPPTNTQMTATTPRL